MPGHGTPTKHHTAMIKIISKAKVQNCRSQIQQPKIFFLLVADKFSERRMIHSHVERRGIVGGSLKYYSTKTQRSFLAKPRVKALIVDRGNPDEQLDSCDSFVLVYAAGW
eukprot:scaffold982_cov169-Amphora_coffeaeformis.AAC.10